MLKFKKIVPNWVDKIINEFENNDTAMLDYTKKELPKEIKKGKGRFV